jgi:hypothetical protein
MTLVGGTGVLVQGTATIAAGTTRTFLVTFINPTSMAFQSVGTGTIS